MYFFVLDAITYARRCSTGINMLDMLIRQQISGQITVLFLLTTTCNRWIYMQIYAHFSTRLYFRTCAIRAKHIGFEDRESFLRYRARALAVMSPDTSRAERNENRSRTRIESAGASSMIHLIPHAPLVFLDGF